MLRTCLTIIWMCCVISASAQTELIKLQDKLIGLSPDPAVRDVSPEQASSIREFWRIFKDIRDAEIELDRLTGTALFGFNGNTSEDQEIFKINGGITLTKGSYPYELEFSTSLNILIDNGKLQENLSNLRISYDRFLELKGDPFLLEGYAFINRRSDQFLGVNQRYEIGAGLILAFWQKRLFDDSQARYDRYATKKLTFNSMQDNVVICDVEKCVPIALPGIDTSDFDVLHSTQQRIANAVIRKRSPMRIGLLVGPFLEVESISFSDSLLTQNGMQFVKEDFATTNHFRWEVRPTFDVRLSERAIIRARPYFKLPMPWEWKIDVAGERVVDYRIEAPIILEVMLSSQFSIRIDYTIYYDHAPNSALQAVPGPFGAPLYLTANQRHEVFNFQVGYTFN
ncbi:MAG: hypothetical protein R3301_01295 [Saprospiraceae bacterium]|nr:hypothetical protein [Saprospiraceae bacterium]